MKKFYYTLASFLLMAVFFVSMSSSAYADFSVRRTHARVHNVQYVNVGLENYIAFHAGYKTDESKIWWVAPASAVAQDHIRSVVLSAFLTDRYINVQCGGASIWGFCSEKTIEVFDGNDHITVEAYVVDGVELREAD